MERNDERATVCHEEGGGPAEPSRDDALRRANRALRVFAAVHDALRDTQDERDLCARICAVAVDVGGYVMAWVGTAEHDERRSVRAVASVGIDAELLERAGLSWADQDAGENPIAGAICTGKPVSVQHILDNAQLAKWHDHARARGYTAAVALPILVGGAALGVLSVYARDGDAFDDEETRLLMQLADNLARAWAALRAEAQRQRAEARLADVLDGVGAVVWASSASDGRLLFINDGATAVLGWPVADLRTIPGLAFEIVHPEDRGLFAEAIAASSTHSPVELDYRIVRRDGEVRWVRSSMRLSRDADGALATVDGVSLDITARREAECARARAEEELRRVNAELEARVADRTRALEEAARAKDEFLASMSHELRTPLSAMLGLSEALQGGVYGSLEPDGIRALARIDESGRHLLSLINDVLDLSKLEAGKAALHRAWLSLGGVCDSSLAMIQQAATAKNQRVSIRTINPSTELYADERVLKQVLVNLLGNAVKFTPNGGSLGLDVEDLGARGVRFTVWDTGIGIASDDMGKLFQSFVQIDAKLSRRHAGTGLGLALVRKLVELHGGTVDVESEVGRGSRFRVVIPRGGERPARGDVSPGSDPRADAPSVESTRRVRRVLLAEDDAMNAETVCDYLRSKGHEVRVARNGNEVVAMARAEIPDVILMDGQMPEMDGLEATRVIRADPAPAVRTIPIVALTALAMSGDRERCLAAGADAYLTKPVRLRELCVVLEAECDRREASSR